MYIRLPKIKHFLLSQASVLLAIVLIELLLRFSGIFILPPHLTQSSNIFGFDHIPNVRATNESTDFKVSVFINADGLRDYEIKKQKQEGVKRIALVGDSFVEGIQVNLEETIAKKLESNLMREYYEVINFGVAGYGIDQKYLYIKEKVAPYEPDLIMLFLSSNDLDDVKNNQLAYEENDNIVFRKTKLPSPKSERMKSLLRKSYLANFIFLISLKKNAVSKQIPIEYKLYMGLTDGEVNRYLNMTEKLVLMSKNEAGHLGSKFVLVLGADRIQADKKYEDLFKNQYNVPETRTSFFNEHFSQFAKESSIVYLDLLPVLKGETEKGRSVYFESDGHWNSYGHQFIANYLTDFVKSNGY